MQHSPEVEGTRLGRYTGDDAVRRSFVWARQIDRRGGLAGLRNPERGSADTASSGKGTDLRAFGATAAAAASSGQSGTPPSFARRPCGRCTAKLTGLASPSSRVRVNTNGLKLPARGLKVPASSFGSKPPLPQPLVICIGAPPVAGGRPDQGENSYAAK